MALLLQVYIIVKLSVNSVKHVLDGEESFVLHYELKCFLFLELFSTERVFFCKVLVAAINTCAGDTSCLLYFALCHYQKTP